MIENTGKAETLENRDGRLSQRLFWNDARPSWKRFGEGWASIEMSGFVGGQWVSFHSTEGTKGEAREVRKEVFHSLNLAQVKALRDFCNLVLDEQATRAAIAKAEGRG